MEIYLALANEGLDFSYLSRVCTSFKAFFCCGIVSETSPLPPFPFTKALFGYQLYLTWRRIILGGQGTVPRTRLNLAGQPRLHHHSEKMSPHTNVKKDFGDQQKFDGRNFKFMASLDDLPLGLQDLRSVIVL